MEKSERVLKALSDHSQSSDYKYERLYRYLFSEEMFAVAYQRIYAKQGNMTPGTDGKTIDEMSLERIERLIVSLKDESYQPHPARRVYIPKKNGKKRPLGIPSFEDKLVQEVVRLLLEAIYEGHFEGTSHGFRPHRSCHTALGMIQKSFAGAKWFIEGDIKGFFDNIDHNVLISILRERISDERFLRLIRKFFNAGYVEDWKYNKTYSGTPQGGIISPILANIYLDKFDKYIKEYAAKFRKGDRRSINPEYWRLNNKKNRLKQKLQKTSDEQMRKSYLYEIAQLSKQMLSTPHKDAMDADFRRLQYVRYADDFLISVIGSKSECETIKADITQFMREQLKLELSDEKTLITHAQDKAKFLGYEIFIRKSDAVKRNRDGVLKRDFNGAVVLTLNSAVIQKKLTEYNALEVRNIDGKDIWWSKPRRYMTPMKPEDILAQYNAEIRGLYNYYSLAANVSKECASFAFIMKMSMFKTLGWKLNTSARKVRQKYQKDKDFVIPYNDAKGKQKYRVFYNEGFKKRNAQFDVDYDKLPQTMYVPYPSLVERLKDGRCELCGKDGKVVMHHVRTLTKLKGNNEWEKLMLQRHRKTLVVCEDCNSMIQNYGKE
ncbi:group II intron reverse transcriptase/maturase [Phocaeicola vulgatus]|uniref:Group II intron reverse transcriptase/maturase n=4 Tax=Bacteroidaceae TaxID=815 RepID=A0A6I1BT54_PHOVU|nr:MULTISPECIES: reverse transcriptase domain-containing protein [Bacteroidaceae]KAB3557270.1 group II intron reverse transcriptase/maturase [Phocaeicola vulgatus]KAB3557566.1 group II intron reverse transcriptase/maturase [Phocaeicola vulgatus]KAB3559325.1 group II intron reverse transcriptase/maturase [Phocaeicola vulgatus]KAB3569053.1 group II intron reverse transcriptase/maturase [Phocaeicola vulgatus]KAB3570759.1 group II intron reverse transcriptase/maturase [Phocaeicola vulgatus]